MSTLHLRLEPDLDGAGELHATAVSGDFSGRASAWFSLAALQAFGSALNDNFPLAPGKRLELEGGVWGSSDPPTLLDVQVGLAVYAIGATGTIGIRVTLATALHDHQRHDCRCSVALALTTDHESLRAFGLAISSMARGWTHEALLHGHAL